MSCWKNWLPRFTVSTNRFDRPLPRKNTSKPLLGASASIAYWLRFSHGQRATPERTRENYLKALQALGQARPRFAYPVRRPTNTIAQLPIQPACKNKLPKSRPLPQSNQLLVEAPVLKRYRASRICSIQKPFKLKYFTCDKRQENKPVHSSMIELTIPNAAQIEARLGTKGWHVIFGRNSPHF